VKRASGRRAIDNSMRDQPVPNVTQADVERILRRDFPAARVEAARSALLACDAAADPPSPRVQLAVLKLAGGNLAKLKQFAADARKDYRDVLAWAEYPGYMNWVPGPGQPPGVEQIIESDWRQYQAWLSR
jgi:hypothetical protein